MRNGRHSGDNKGSQNECEKWRLLELHKMSLIMFTANKRLDGSKEALNQYFESRVLNTVPEETQLHTPEE